MNFNILSLLADGQYRSGSDIGAQLGVSRAAVWKHIKQLQEQGLPIVSHQGKGYCWSGGGDLLAVEQIQQNTGASRQHPVEVFSQLDSTNKVALAAVLDGKPSGYTCFAELQTDGRGRRGREWLSPLAQNLYFSMVFRVGGGIQALQGLSLAVGIILAEAINGHYKIGCLVKWPNDLLVSGNKLGGILVELAGDASGDCAAVIGIGLNCNMSATGGPVDRPWTSLANELEHVVSRNKVAGELLSALHEGLDLFRREGFTAFESRWLALDALMGKPVVVGGDSSLNSGVVQGVDNLGGLKLQTQLGAKVFYGGEVSVRLS